MTRLLSANLVVIALALTPGAAAPHGQMTVGSNELWLSWHFDFLVLAPLALVHWVYGRGLFRLWAAAGPNRGVSRLQAFAWACGEAALLVALVSPLDRLGGTLLSAHMAQHGLLITVAPLLLLLGAPGAALVWGLPLAWRHGLLRSRPWRLIVRLVNALSRPMQATCLHALMIWVWHAPAPFQAALANEWIHSLEHASFFVSALFLWRAILNVRRTSRVGPAIGAAFITLMHSGFLGALITLSPYVLYDRYRARAPLWNLSALQDQQFAGLLMWIPMSAFYAGACLVLAARLVACPAAARMGCRPISND